MVASQQGILAVGGYNGSNYRQEILKLQCDPALPNCQWNPMAKGLNIGREYHIIIPFPRSGSVDYSSLCKCKDASETCISCKSGFVPKWTDGRIGCCECNEIGTASCTKSQTGDLCSCHLGYAGTRCEKSAVAFNFFPFPNCTRSKPSK